MSKSIASLLYLRQFVLSNVFARIYVYNILAVDFSSCGGYYEITEIIKTGGYSMNTTKIKKGSSRFLKKSENPDEKKYGKYSLMNIKRDFHMNKGLYLLMIPVLLYYIYFRYVPMFGAIIAFNNQFVIGLKFILVFQKRHRLISCNIPFCRNIFTFDFTEQFLWFYCPL